MRNVTPPEPRFWAKVSKSDGCWEWQGGTTPNGYGHFTVRRGSDPFQTSAHRYSFALNVGPIPDGLFVLHTCDNRKCVRPEHLFLGTHQDNMDDMVQKGRVVSVMAGATECQRGHPFDEANTIRRSDGGRTCRACANASVRAHKARRRAALKEINGPYVRELKTHCKRGHAYDEANTYLYPSGLRGCRECRRLYKQGLI